MRFFQANSPPRTAANGLADVEHPLVAAPKGERVATATKLLALLGLDQASLSDFELYDQRFPRRASFVQHGGAHE